MSNQHYVNVIECADFDKNLIQLLQSVAKNAGFADFSIEKLKNKGNETGYLGAIEKLRIVENVKSNTIKPLYIVLKMAPKLDALRQVVPVAVVYKREIYTYNTIFKLFKTLEKEKNINRPFFAPNLYKERSLENNELLIMEDLSESGFKMFKGKRMMDNDHINMVIDVYARLHALSFAIRDQQPENFKKYFESLENIIEAFLIKTEFLKVLIVKCEATLDIVKSSLSVSDFERYKNFVTQLPNHLNDLLNCIDKYSAFTHGDCWTNNIMFRYHENKLVEVKLIDFQIAKLGPPAFDLSYFLYSCGSKAVLDNLKDYLRFYHDKLSFYLEELGTDIEKVFPYSAFENQWKQYVKIALSISIVAIQLILSEKDEVVDLSKFVESGENVLNAFNYNVSSIDLYKERILYNILHCIKNNYI